MLFFALFTAGYLFGVFTALAIFPPRVKEIEEQEKDALLPLKSLDEESNLGPRASFGSLGSSLPEGSVVTPS